MKYTARELERDLNKLISTPMGRRAFMAALPTLLAGCASVTSNRYREGSNQGQNTSITVADEIKMTQEYLPQMKKDYPPYQSSYLQSYISDLGQKIVYANGLHNQPYTYNFTLVQSKAVNAFALPAGTVFVTGPLLAMADSEAELAGVIGHEIGHVVSRHTAERIDKAKEEQNKSILYGIGGGLAGLALGHGLGKLVCSKEDQECLARIRKYGAAAGAIGGLLIQKYSFMANSREDEMEADRVGFKTSVAAQYNKDHVGRFYSKLLQMEKQQRGNSSGIISSVADAMSTHPPSEERVRQMNQMARNANNMPGTIISTNEFMRAKKLV